MFLEQPPNDSFQSRETHNETAHMKADKNLVYLPLIAREFIQINASIPGAGKANAVDARIVQQAQLGKVKTKAHPQVRVSGLVVANKFIGSQLAALALGCLTAELFHNTTA